MKSVKTFSKFMMVSLILIMGISVVLAATGVYIYRIRQIDRAEIAIFENGQQRFSDTLSKQFEYVGIQIDAVATDSSIIDSIENGQHQHLLDIVTAQYATGPSRQIAFYDQLQGRFIQQDSTDVSSLQPLMKKLGKQKQATTYFQKTDSGHFITIFSAPVISAERRIATAYLLYNLSNDRHFWEIVKTPQSTLKRILIKSGEDHLWDLQTCEEIAVPEIELFRQFSANNRPARDVLSKEILLPLASYPDLFYTASDQPLREQKQTVLMVLTCICIAVLMMTFGISYFIANIVSKPLKNMANEAMQIARAPSNVTLDEEKVEHLEFKQLAHAFNEVLLSLFAAQEKLKAEAGEEKKRLEQELHRAMKMEAVGAMAGGVAHDLNNILSGLVSYPELLLMDLPEDSPLRKPILTIQKSGEKAAAIVQDMLTLARRNVNVTEVVNLNGILQEYLSSPEHLKIMSYHPDVGLTTDLEPNLLNIVGSGVHLSKTLMNLVSNALEAMPNGGEIRIATRNEYVDFPVTGYDTVNEGDYIVLTISDNGMGIDPKDREKIFEPFYTKKTMGRSGTGLGMAVVWGTVKDHNGYIDLKSETGAGTTFTLYFPVTRKELLENEADLVVDQYMGKGETVLVVDDVQEQRDIASDMLTRLGYHVSNVPSGEKAVLHLKAHPVDIVVLDMIMAPGIDGLETYKRILEIRPGQKAIVASGFSETQRVREVQQLGAGAYVKKPYLLKNIGPAIRKVLDA